MKVILEISNYYIHIIFIVILIMSVSCSTTAWYEKCGLEKSNLMTQEAMPILIQALDDTDPNVRISVIRVIARNRMRTEAAPKLKEMEESDPDDRVRAYAKKAIRNINPYSGHKPIAVEITGSAPFSAKIIPKLNIFNGYKDDNITRRVGILPLELIIQNNSSNPVNIMAKYIRLIDETGTEQSLLPIETVINKSKYSLGAFMYRSIKANNRIDLFYRRNELRDDAIHSGSEYNGLVFFNVDRFLASLKGYQLEIPFKIERQPHIVTIKFLE